MGTAIGEILPKREMELSELSGKTIAIDAYNTLYAFLTTIRQPNGTPLQNSDGEITSHLSGLFYRTIRLLEDGILPVFVFDGKPPALKEAEIARRRELKEAAVAKFEAAKGKGDIEEMRKFSSQFVGITKRIVIQSKELLTALGAGVVQAPSEGEAEAAFLARMGKVWASASQDYDSLLYGVPYLVRNLTLARKKKISSGIYVDVMPELIELRDVLDHLEISLDQLICLAILAGTDYNPGGVKGVGAKRALELVRRFEFPVELFRYLQKNDKYEVDFDWEEIFAQFHEYESEPAEFSFGDVDEEKVMALLSENGFSSERIENGLAKLRKLKEVKKQKGLGEFF